MSEHSLQEGEKGLKKEEEIGGQVTIFTKQDCSYCVRLQRTLEKCVDKVLKENPEGRITWKFIDCTGADASLCVRLTGSFSVPHVFFNREYIGDCSKTCASAEVPEEDKNVILQKLKDIASSPKLDPPFPPPPDAVITKITDDLACSSQPTEEQLEKLVTRFGFRSVLNLSSPLESSFYQGEGDLLKSADPSLQYVHSPMMGVSPQVISKAMDEVTNLEKPALIHCDTGQRSLLVALLIATEKEETVSEESFINWGKDLDVNLSQLAKHALQTREWRRKTKCFECCKIENQDIVDKHGKGGTGQPPSDDSESSEAHNKRTRVSI